jgi:protein-S-isoprenylcysteine O-methyltransferase Ste14
MIVAELPRQGDFLFRHRSYIPLVLLIPVAIALARLDRTGLFPDSHEWWAFLCFVVSSVGLLVRIMTVGFVPRGTSGRNSKSQVAVVLNTTGLYSIVRHPLYVGNFLMWLGMVLCVGDFAVVAMFVCAFWLYYERIMSAEESFLADRFGFEWQRWASETPAVVPRLSLWRRPSMSFSIRSVLRREYCGLLGLAVAFASLDLARHAIIEGRLLADTFWLVFLAVSFLAFVVFRTMKKHTRLLNVSGR